MNNRISSVSAALATAILVMTGSPVLSSASSQFITVKSHYGNGTLRTPVRVSEYGFQARLPSGSWINCQGRSGPGQCIETVRREYLDYWETRSEESPGM